MEPPPHGGGELSMEKDDTSTTRARRNGAAPSRGRRVRSQNHPRRWCGPPQWSRPLTGAERCDGPNPAPAAGLAAMEPPPHGGGEFGCLCTVYPRHLAAMEPPPHGGGESTLVSPSPAPTISPQWSRPLTGAESCGTSCSWAPAPATPQWSRPLTGAESDGGVDPQGDHVDGRNGAAPSRGRRDPFLEHQNVDRFPAAMEPPPHGGGERP